MDKSQIQQAFSGDGGIDAWEARKLYMDAKGNPTKMAGLLKDALPNLSQTKALAAADHLIKTVRHANRGVTQDSQYFRQFGEAAGKDGLLNWSGTEYKFVDEAPEAIRIGKSLATPAKSKEEGNIPGRDEQVAVADLERDTVLRRQFLKLSPQLDGNDATTTDHSACGPMGTLGIMVLRRPQSVVEVGLALQKPELAQVFPKVAEALKASGSLKAAANNLALGTFSPLDLNTVMQALKDELRPGGGTNADHIRRLVKGLNQLGVTVPDFTLRFLSAPEGKVNHWVAKGGNETFDSALNSRGFATVNWQPWDWFSAGYKVTYEVAVKQGGQEVNILRHDLPIWQGGTGRGPHIDAPAPASRVNPTFPPPPPMP